MSRGPALLPLPTLGQLPFALPGLPQGALPFVGTAAECLQLQVALSAVERVISAVTGRPARIQFDDGVHQLQKRPVVAHDQHGRAAPADVVVQQRPRTGIEVVARLVEQHRAGARQLRPGQQDARALAAAQRTERPVEGDRSDSPTAAHGIEPLPDAPIVVERREIGLRTAPGLDGMQRSEFTGYAQQLRDRFAGLAQGVLGQIPARRRAADRSGGRLQPGSDAQQCGFARAVRADQGDPFARADGEGDVGKKGFRTGICERHPAENKRHKISDLKIYKVHGAASARAGRQKGSMKFLNPHR